jgi:hypothetical protein
MLALTRPAGSARMRTLVTIVVWVCGVVAAVLFFRSVLGGRIRPLAAGNEESWLVHRAVGDCRLGDWARFTAVTSSEVGAVELAYRVVGPSGDTAESHSVDMAYCQDGRLWALALPPLEKGWAYRYTLTAGGADGTLRIPASAELRARFEADVSPGLILAHVIPTLAAGVLLLLAFRVALAELTGIRSGVRHRLWVALAVALFGVGAIVVGMMVSQRALGASWGGWPFGNDVTDTKSEAIVLYWILLLALTTRNARLSALGTLVGTIGTLVLYLLPHGGVT